METQKYIENEMCPHSGYCLFKPEDEFDRINLCERNFRECNIYQKIPSVRKTANNRNDPERGRAILSVLTAR